MSIPRVLVLAACASVVLAACGPGTTSSTTVADSSTTSTPVGTEASTTLPVSTTADTTTTTTTPVPSVGSVEITYVAPLVDANDLIPGATKADPAAVVDADGVTHLMWNAYEQWVGPVNIGHGLIEAGSVTSVSDPLVTTDDVPYAEVAVVGTSMLHTGGEWVLYFHVWQNQSPRLGDGFIGRATAESPSGPWRIDPEPVLIQGEIEEWDGGQVSQADVVETASGFTMFYTGADRKGFMRIGMATSDDGINWTKHDDPSTSDPKFANSDPIIAPGTGWDGNGTYQARVVPGEPWLLLYRSFGSNAEQYGIGYATSTDGIEWTKGLPDQPVADPTLVPDGRYFNQFVVTGSPEAFTVYIGASPATGAGTIEILAGSFLP